MKELINIQSELKAPKNQRNNFGKYNYRSAEDILEALKPLLKQEECALTITDEVVLIGSRYYIKATVTIESETGFTRTASALAREEETKKGMDGAQITGSASSYARKYALNGLFCIDDTKDPDSTNQHGKLSKEEQEKEDIDLTVALSEVSSAKTIPELAEVWTRWSEYQSNKAFKLAVTEAKKLLPDEAK